MALSRLLLTTLHPMLFAAAVGLTACNGENTPAQGEFNVAVAPPSGSPLIDTVSHNIHTDQEVPFRGVFRMEAGKCTRFNLHFIDDSWAGGLNCTDPPPPTHRRRLLKVKGRDGTVQLLRACCPHNKPCYTNGQDTTGADFLLGVRADGSLATTVAEFRELCRHEPIEGAIDFPDSLFERDAYPDLTGVRLNRNAPAPTPLSTRSAP